MPIILVYNAAAMNVLVHPDVFSIARLSPDAPVPDCSGCDWYSVTRTPDELSVVAPQEILKRLRLSYDQEWSCISVAQKLDFSLTGVVAGMTRPLADAGIPVFVVSSYDMDHILVPKDRCREAVEILKNVQL